jgi:hypothetical protein
MTRRLARVIAAAIITCVAVGVSIAAQAPDPWASVRAKTLEELAFADHFTEPPDLYARPLVPGQRTSRVFDYFSIEPPPIPGPAAVLHEQVCQSDLVVVGSGTRLRSLVNRDATSIFSVFRISVGVWIRPLQVSDPLMDSPLLVGQEGGTVTVDAGTTKVTVSPSPDLSTTNTLFLKRLGQTSAFVVRLVRNDAATEDLKQASATCSSAADPR